MVTEAKPAYWIAHVTITDEEIYAGYWKLAAEAVTSHGGRFVARGGRYKQMQGQDKTPVERQPL